MYPQRSTKLLTSRQLSSVSFTFGCTQFLYIRPVTQPAKKAETGWQIFWLFEGVLDIHCEKFPEDSIFFVSSAQKLIPSRTMLFQGAVRLAVSFVRAVPVSIMLFDTMFHFFIRHSETHC
jgi:hypothetical protein